jgi:hypothetical protein
MKLVFETLVLGSQVFHLFIVFMPSQREQEEADRNDQKDKLYHSSVLQS